MMIASVLTITLLGWSTAASKIVEYGLIAFQPNVAPYKHITTSRLLNCVRMCNNIDCEFLHYSKPSCYLFNGTGYYSAGTRNHLWRKDLGCLSRQGVLVPHGTISFFSQDCVQASCLLGKTIPSNSVRTICDAGYSQNGTLGCVSLVLGPGNWCNKRLYCTSTSQSADLITGADPADITAVFGNSDLWLGARGTTWADGVLIPSTYWAPGHPTSDPKACVMIKNGKLQHENCSTTLIAACQRKGAILGPIIIRVW